MTGRTIVLFDEIQEFEEFARACGTAASVVDIARHMSDNEGIRFAQTVYEAMPGQLNKENERLKYSGLARDGEAKSHGKRGDWSSDSPGRNEGHVPPPRAS